MGEEIRNVRSVCMFVDAPFDSVWAWVSNPSRFPTIYPSWVKRVKKLPRAEGEAYEGVSWDGNRFGIVRRCRLDGNLCDFRSNQKLRSTDSEDAHVCLIPCLSGILPVLRICRRRREGPE